MDAEPRVAVKVILVDSLPSPVTGFAGTLRSGPLDLRRPLRFGFAGRLPQLIHLRLATLLQTLELGLQTPYLLTELQHLQPGGESLGLDRGRLPSHSCWSFRHPGRPIVFLALAVTCLGVVKVEEKGIIGNDGNE
eukprot:scaffold2579_cov356-Prasinococcus_capsulatus_cf.AAC.8